MPKYGEITYGKYVYGGEYTPPLYNNGLQLMVLDNTEQLVAVLSNVLPEACPISDFRQVQEMQDGGTYIDTCLLTVPANHADTAYLINGNYLLFQDEDGYWQEYKIVIPERQDSATGSYITITGENAFYELLGEPLDDIRPTTTTATAAVIEAIANTRWAIGTGDDLGSNSCRIYKTSVLSGLATIAKTWGGELRFRVNVGGNAITERIVDILTQRGNVTGKRFEFKKDLTGVTQTINTQNLCTALIGRGKGVEVYGGTETEDPAYGRRLEFTDEVWTVAGGDPAEKPAGQNWIGDSTAAAAYGPGGRHIYGFVNFDDCTDAGELLQRTYDELQIRKVPQTTYDLSAIVLEEITGYEHEAVRLGDTVNVINTAVSPAITGTARVIKLDRSRINPMNCSVTLGNYIPTTSSVTSALQLQQQAMLDRSGVWDRATAIEQDTSGLGDLAYKIDLLKTQLSSTVSGVYTDINGNIVIENTAQTMALKLGAGILALANTKTAGEYNWRTFATGDGYTASEMTTGTMNAAIVFAGILFGASGTFADLVAGITGAQRVQLGSDTNNEPFIKFYDNSNTLKLTLTKIGVTFGANTTLIAYTLGDRSGVGIFIN